MKQSKRSAAAAAPRGRAVKGLLAVVSLAAALSMQACTGKAKPPELLETYRGMVSQVGYTGVLPQDIASLDVAHILFPNGTSRGDPIWAYCTDVQGPAAEDIIASGGAATFSTNHHEIMTWNLSIDGTPQELTTAIPELSVSASGTDAIKVTMNVSDTEIRIAKDAALGVYLTDFDAACRKGLAPFDYVTRVLMGVVEFKFQYVDEDKGSVRIGWKRTPAAGGGTGKMVGLMSGVSLNGLWRVGSDGTITSTKKLVIGYMTSNYRPR